MFDTGKLPYLTDFLPFLSKEGRVGGWLKTRLWKNPPTPPPSLLIFVLFLGVISLFWILDDPTLQQALWDIYFYKYF